MPWSATDTIPSLKNKSLAVRALFARVANEALKTRSEEEAGPLPHLATVTIVNTSTTATVTHTLHGMSTGDKVVIKGASHYQNNGVFTITVSDVNTYTYSMSTAPGSNPTGTITSTYVLLSGLTDTNGQITMSRVFNADQPVSGWARKSTSAPYYKTGLINGTVDSSNGAAFSALLIPDE